MPEADRLRVIADPERLGAPRRLLLLDTGPNATVDRLTLLAAELLESPIALLTSLTLTDSSF